MRPLQNLTVFVNPKKEGGLFFGSKGYVYLFFDTEEPHAVMLTKDAD